MRLICLMRLTADQNFAFVFNADVALQSDFYCVNFIFDRSLMLFAFTDSCGDNSLTSSLSSSVSNSDDLSLLTVTSFVSSSCTSNALLLIQSASLILPTLLSVLTFSKEDELCSNVIFICLLVFYFLKFSTTTFYLRPSVSLKIQRALSTLLVMISSLLRSFAVLLSFGIKYQLLIS